MTTVTDGRKIQRKRGMEQNRKKSVRKDLKGNRSPLIYWSLSCCLGRASSTASLSISRSLSPVLSSASLVGDQRVNEGERGEIPCVNRTCKTEDGWSRGWSTVPTCLLLSPHLCFLLFFLLHRQQRHFYTLRSSRLLSLM